MLEKPPTLEEIEAEVARRRQEIWRQRQLDTFYRVGRPIFGVFREDIGKPIVSSLSYWQNKHYLRRNVFRTYKQKNSGTLSVFE